MSVANPRRYVDTAVAAFIRGTSLLVLLLVMGMLVQLVAGAFPLLYSPEVISVSSPSPSARATSSKAEIAVPGKHLRSKMPSWIPEGINPTAWFEGSNQRLWVSVSSLSLGGSRLLGGGYTLDLQNQDWRERSWSLPRLDRELVHIGFNGAGTKVLLFDTRGYYALLDVLNDGTTSTSMLWLPLPGFNKKLSTTAEGGEEEIRIIESLPGNRSWLVAEGPRVQRLHLVNNGGEFTLQVLKTLDTDKPVTAIAPGPSGSLLLLLNAQNALELWSLVSAQPLWQTALTSGADDIGWLTANQFYSRADGDALHFWQVDQGNQEVTLERLFQPVLYESYPEPVRLWQPSSTSPNFETKLNLMPLLIGTLKAAAVALMLALPLAVGSAVFVGFFMPDSMRNRVKTIIELIAAFPSVVVGAVVALWLAPHLLAQLLPILGAIITLVGGVIALAIFSQRFILKGGIGKWLPMTPLLLIPVVTLLLTLGAGLGRAFEALVFDPSLITWLYSEQGVIVQNRNALLVGIALGFAIIPVIFSVAEDAINAVPKSAAASSLALGATAWESFTATVLPVAAPGIVAAMMLGFGRALGETMILLLVAGNSPIDDWSLLNGLQTLSATLAIELPESHVGSAHYRVLFFAALMLLALSLLVNTLAQLLKRYMRYRFGVRL